jgi:serine/threonine protein kinase
VQSSAATTANPRFVPFGRYLLLERVAIGGMAEVYLAKSFEENGEVSDILAIKRILPRLQSDEQFIRMFLDEAKIAGQLIHPGIAQIRELGRVGAAHYLAMDYVWGKDLLQVMRRCRLLGTQMSPAIVAWIGASACEALAYAHEKKDRHGEPMRIIHRDVSPQNVLMSFDGKVKVIDFGIAKAASRSTQTQAGVLKGKVGYMSPEQVEGKVIDHRSDLFAIGTCLYELLTLKSLFARENSFESLENVRAAAVRPIREVRPDVPVELFEILKRALARDREERYQSARDLAHALHEFLNMVEPGWSRVDAVSWLRDAFRKEFNSERVRLDAFDQIGRAQIAPADEPRRNSVTDLEIGHLGAAPPDFDEEGETLVFDEVPTGSQPNAEPGEVFFRATDPNVQLVEEPLDVPATPARPRDPAPRAVLEDPFKSGDAFKSDAFTSGVSDHDISLAPAQINSGVIEALMPAPNEKAKAAREPTDRHRYDRHQESIAPPRPKTRSISPFIAAVLGLLLLGAGIFGTYLFLTMGGSASIEVRTRPSVNAIVLLDGARRGNAPVRLENVEPGTHQVTILADGYEDVRHEVDLHSNSTAIVDVSLVPVADR